MIEQRLPGECSKETLQVVAVHGFGFEGCTHRTVQGWYPKLCIDLVMQYGDITEAGYPFRPAKEGGEINIVYDPAEAISPAPHQDGVQVRVVQHPLQILQALSIGSGEIVVL